MSILAIHGDLYGILCRCFPVVAEHWPLSHDAVVRLRQALMELQASLHVANQIVFAHRTTQDYVQACLTPGALAYHLDGAPAYPLSNDDKGWALARYRGAKESRRAQAEAAQAKAERRRLEKELAAAKQKRREAHQQWASLTPQEREARKAVDIARKATNKATDQARHTRNKQQERERVAAALERLKAQGKLYRHGAAMQEDHP